MGILFALTALFAWGLADFLIERSTRKFGDWIALFFITSFSSVVLFPFVYQDLLSYFTIHHTVLLLAGTIMLCASLLNFEALRMGKISVVEPIYALEVVVIIFLSAVVIKEQLSSLQLMLVFLSMVGIFLISTKSFTHLRRVKLEKGTWYALFAAILMGTATFTLGMGSRDTSPLTIVWFTNAFITVVALLYLILSSKLGEVVRDFKENKRLIFNVSFFDTLAWIMFCYATLYIPIAVATGISEGYIAFASFLGLVFNKEKLKRHQVAGFFIAFASILLLAFNTQ